MNETVLIVDDEIDLANTCARLLKQAGFNCIVAYHLNDALSIFDAKHPSIVLADINLGDGEGYEIARSVKQKSPSTPIILMTAYHSPRAVEQARQAGAARYLRKPFTNAELISVVTSTLIQP